MKKKVVASESKQNVHILSTESVNEAVTRLTAGRPCKKLVINGLFDKNYLYRELKKAEESGEPLSIVIDQKTVGHDFKGLTETPPHFAGLNLSPHLVVVIPKEHSGMSKASTEGGGLGDPELLYTIKPTPQWAEYLIENREIQRALIDRRKVCLTHFVIPKNEETQFKEAMAIRVGVPIEDVNALLTFKQGVPQQSIESLGRLKVLPPDRLKSAGVKTVILNQETVRHLAKQIDVKKAGGVLAVKKGLLEEMKDAILVIKEPLNAYAWHLLAEALETDQPIVLGPSVEIPGRGREESLISEMALKPQEVADVGFALSGLNLDEEVLVEAHSELSMGDLLGRITITDKENKQGKFDIEASGFVQELNTKKKLVIVDRGKNKAFMKEIETLLLGRPPYLYLYGQKVEFEGLEVRVIKEDKTMAKPGLDRVINKAIEKFSDPQIQFKLNNLEIKQELKRVCKLLPNHQQSYVGVQKLLRQIRMEQKYDKARDLKVYHVKKAASSVLKELKLTHKDYLAMKTDVWGAESPPQKTAEDKAIEDALYVQLHQGVLKDYMFESGLGVVLDEERRLPKAERNVDHLIYMIMAGMETTPELNIKDQIRRVLVESQESTGRGPEKRAENKLKRKDIRAAEKLKAHRLLMMLGPTGSGKTAMAERLNVLLNGEPATALLQVNVGLVKGVPEILGEEQQHTLDTGEIVSRFEPGLLKKSMQLHENEGVENPIVVIDEATMVEDFGMMNQIIERGHLWINGEKVSPGLIYMTGNEGAEYTGRKTSTELSSLGMIMKRGKMSARELASYIVRPELAKIEQLSDADQNKVIAVIEKTMILLEEKCGVTADQFGSRELKDLVANIGKRWIIYGEDDVMPARAPGVSEVTFQSLYELSASLVGKTKIATLHQELNQIFEEQDFRFKEDNLNKLSKVKRIKERATYIRDGVQGIKPGVILDCEMDVLEAETDADDLVCMPSKHVVADVLKEVTKEAPVCLRYECEAQWPEIRAAIEFAYEKGKPIIIEDADKIPGDLLESVTNDLLNELKPGFGVYLIATKGVDIKKSFNPSQLSRLCQIEESYFTFAQAREILKTLPDAVGDGNGHDLKDSETRETVSNYSNDSQSGSHLESAKGKGRRKNKKKDVKEFEAVLAEVQTTRNCLFAGLCGLVTPFLGLLRKLGSRRVEMNPEARGIKMIEYYSSGNHRFLRTEVKVMGADFQFRKVVSSYEEVPVNKLSPNICNLEAILTFNRKGFAPLPMFTREQIVTGYSEIHGDLTFFRNEHNLWKVKRNPAGRNDRSKISLKVENHELHKTALINQLEGKELKLSAVECPEEFKAAMEAMLSTNNATGEPISNDIGIVPEDSKFNIAKKICKYVNSFEEKYIRMKKLYKTSKDKCLHLMKHKMGVCRQQAWVAAALLKYYGIKAFIEESDVHVWVVLELEAEFEGRKYLILDTNTTKTSSQNRFVPSDNGCTSELEKSDLTKLENITYQGKPLAELLKKLSVSTRASSEGGELSTEAFASGSGEWFQASGVEVGNLKKVVLSKDLFCSEIDKALTNAGVAVLYVGSDEDLTAFDSMNYLTFLTEEGIVDGASQDQKSARNIDFWSDDSSTPGQRLLYVLDHEKDSGSISRILKEEVGGEKEIWNSRQIDGGNTMFMNFLFFKNSIATKSQVIDLELMRGPELWLEKNIHNIHPLEIALRYLENESMINKILNIPFMETKEFWDELEINPSDLCSCTKFSSVQKRLNEIEKNL